MLRPRNEAELVEVISACRRNGRKVRVHGARHSVSPAIGTGERGGVEVSLDKMDEVTFEAENTLVTVGPGCRMGADPLDRRGWATFEQSLAGNLVRSGRALCNVGGVMSQTLVGFLSTGSAGGSTRYGLHSRVRRIRFIDGQGRAHDIDASSPLFPFAGVSMGLLGVITSVTLETDPHYDVVGSEVVVARSEAPFDLLGSDASGIFRYLDEHDYARVFWFPQPGVQKLVLWSANRAGPGDYNSRTGPPAAFTAKPYRALPTFLGTDAPVQRLAGLALGASDVYPTETIARAVIESFLPEGKQLFWDRWDRALPMDGNIDERVLPFEFAEFWFDRDDAPEALARLDAYFDRYRLRATGNFAVELYAGPPTPFVMSPGFERNSLRINLIHPAKNRAGAASQFAPIFDLFRDMAPRLHWGKHLPPPPQTSPWVARAWPHVDDFLSVREELDPDGVFLSGYFRDRLGVRPASALVRSDLAIASSDPIVRRSEPAVAPSLVRWPLVFDLEPIGVDFIAEATRHFNFSMECFADPDQLFDAMVHMDDAAEWMDQFVRMEKDEHDPEHVFDEHYTFMRLRGRTLIADRPRRWVARIEAASLPLATRLIEVVEIGRQPSGRTHLSWRISLDPHPLTMPIENGLRSIFERLFDRSLQRLAALSEQRAGIVRP
jgi:FAD/FMN-containing dehydrogenase